MTDATPIDLALGGAGGVYFLAEPGELVVHLQKRDRNIYNRRTDLRAVLAGPDRRVIRDVTLPDTGPGDGPGPVQQARLSATVKRKGVYALNITISNDRYGEEIAWGFSTNCRRYLIETSRGHRDAAHQEPIVLLNPNAPGNVCFLPRPGSFSIEVAGLPDGIDALPVYTAGGECIHTLSVEGNRAAHTFPETIHRHSTPWRLHLPAAQATIHIDGVTRWDRDDRYTHLSLWTPDIESFFPFHTCRWLLTPYGRTVYAAPGEQGEIAYRVHNNSDRTGTVRLSLEFPNGAEWPVRLSRNAVELGPKEAAEVLLQYTTPGADASTCHLRATPDGSPDFTTYSTLTLKTGAAPCRQNLDMPILLEPYRHENEQFGYLPDYPVENQVYFDLENRPFIRTETGVCTLRDGTWTASDLRTSVRSFENATFGVRSSILAFDSDNDLYLIATLDGRPALLRSADGGRAFSAAPMDGPNDLPCTFDIEQFTGHNLPDGPPPVLRYTQTAADPERIWRRFNDLDLFLPEKHGEDLHWGDPVRISDTCIGLSQHSGIPATVVSRGSKVHVTWAEATDPDEDIPGVPTCVTTYDRETGKLGEPALVGYGPPANDVHNTPSITMDGRGHLHVLAGTHGRPFPYARSLKPNDACAGWTDAEVVWEGARQTYIGLVCAPDDTLHAAFRLWFGGTEHFPAGNYGALAHQQKRPGAPWEEPRVLVVPPFSEYSVYYHRLTTDRAGRLFLSYDYFSTYWFYRTDHVGKRRALIMSSDGGENWKLVETADLA